jgi:alpha-glucosidase
MVRFYGERDDELSLAFNFNFLHNPLDASLRDGVAIIEGSIPAHAWPAWTGSNHDVSRFPTRWAHGDAAKTKCALLMLLALRGTPVVYYGDEIGMEDTEFRKEQLRDPVGQRFFPVYAGRDPCRTPMVWSGDEGGGFTDAGVEPWLPFGSLDRNVGDQRDDPDSILTFCRDALAVRKEVDDLRRAPYEALLAPDGVWAWRRGGATVALNLSDHDIVLDGVEGAIRLATLRSREGEDIRGAIRLGAFEGALLT